jgi:hypothetical protein
MPGRIEGYEQVVAAAAYIPVWKLRLFKLLRRKGK